MDAIRTVVSMLGTFDETCDDLSPQADMLKSIGLLAKIPTAVAANFRLRKKQSVIPPDASLSFSENFYYMCFGKKPDEMIARGFDVSLILYAEHGFNASTFTSRVIVSSLADLYGAIAGAIASLKGPLHGGANEAVMKMFLEIKEPSLAVSWLEKKIAGER